MKKDEKRVLSEEEQKRLARFEQTAQELTKQGYTRHDLTIGMGKASWIAIFLLIPLFIAGYGLYYLVHHKIEMTGFNGATFLIVFLLLTVVHELIHGISWSIFTPNHFKDIAFGIMMPYLSPYCTCMAPLTKPRHIFGTVMPLILLGIVPAVIGIAAGIPMVLLMGLLMIDIATGDILIILKILAYKTSAKDVVYMDHPTDAGGVIFER